MSAATLIERDFVVPDIRCAGCIAKLEQGLVRDRRIAAARGLRRHAAMMNARPARIMGTDNSIPIVSPPHRNPSCGSGSRKNSLVMRAIP